MSRRLLPTLAALLVAGLPWGCGGADDAAERPGNLILISVDTLRADHLGCYGYGRDTSPSIDALAAQGVLFESCLSTTGWTIPAHVSMLSGLYPRTHGVDGWEKRIPHDVPVLAEMLRERGYATWGRVNAYMLDETFGFGRGFDSFESVPTSQVPEGTTRKLVNRVAKWLARSPREPFFAFLHFYDVHADYVAEDEYLGLFRDGAFEEVTGKTGQLKRHRRGLLNWGEREAAQLAALYDAGLRQFDDDLGRLLALLDEHGVRDDTLVVLTSDHGEEFLEHGDVLHGRTVHQELLHVPLIMAGPGLPAGLRVAEDASLVDVVPTVLSLLGVTLDRELDGLDLSRAWRRPGEPPADRPTFAEADKWYDMDEGNFRRAVRKGRFKLTYDHLSGERRVFDLEEDPGELRDIGADQPVLRDALWRELEAFMAGKRAVEASVEMSPEELEVLKELGYL